MSIVSPKRVHHLARYFGILAVICLAGYQFFGLPYLFLPFLGPPLYLTYLLRAYAPFLNQALPNEPFFNSFFILFPLTFIYFGLVGFQLKNIINERGRLGTLLLLVFVGFLGYVHYLTFQEFSLYWEGSKNRFYAEKSPVASQQEAARPLADSGLAQDRTVGDKQG